MDCENPMLAKKIGDKYRFIGAVNGSSAVNRKYLYDTTGNFIVLPCGQCMACRLNKSRDWATRCVLEAKMHKENCFITLTYDDDHLPSDYGLHKEDLTNFWKRLRFNTGCKFRYYAAGEYGDLYSRPHYHACIFGWRPDDMQLYTVRNGVNLYISETLLRAWQGRGFVTVGDVTFESAAYVARYVTKKITGSLSEEHYCGRQPEYNVMSRRPGIGASFMEKYGEDIYGKDFIVIRDKIKCKPPRYFDSIYDQYYGEGSFDEVVRPRRIQRGVKSFNKNLEEYTFSRIVNRARFKDIRYKTKFTRILDKEC